MAMFFQAKATAPILEVEALQLFPSVVKILQFYVSVAF